MKDGKEAGDRKVSVEVCKSLGDKKDLMAK